MNKKKFGFTSGVIDGDGMIWAIWFKSNPSRIINVGDDYHYLAKMINLSCKESVKKNGSSVKGKLITQIKDVLHELSEAMTAYSRHILDNGSAHKESGDKGISKELSGINFAFCTQLLADYSQNNQQVFLDDILMGLFAQSFYLSIDSCYIPGDILRVVRNNKGNVVETGKAVYSLLEHYNREESCFIPSVDDFFKELLPRLSPEQAKQISTQLVTFK